MLSILLILDKRVHSQVEKLQVGIRMIMVMEIFFMMSLLVFLHYVQKIYQNQQLNLKNILRLFYILVMDQPMLLRELDSHRV